MRWPFQATNPTGGRLQPMALLIPQCKSDITLISGARKWRRSPEEAGLCRHQARRSLLRDR
jgi:hypothetical protein